MCRRWPEGCDSKPGLCHPMTGKFCQISSKWVPVWNQGRIWQGKERDGFCLSSAALRYSGSQTPTAPIASRLWKTFTICFITSSKFVQSTRSHEMQSQVWPSYIHQRQYFLHLLKHLLTKNKIKLCKKLVLG